MTDIRPYTGVRVLDLTQRYGTYAGKLFADLGAEVIAPAPNGGDFVLAFSAASKSLLNGDASDETLRELAKSSQIILLEKGGPLSGEWLALSQDCPAAVIIVISPFGLDGPWADRPASDLTLQAAGGIAYLSGTIDRAPLRLPFEQSVPVASVYAAVVSAIAFWDAEKTGRGHVIDISVQECIAHSLQNAIQVYDLEDRISMRGGEGTRDCSEDHFPCKDGYVFTVVSPMLGDMWNTFLGWLAEVSPDTAQALSDPKWRDRPWRTTAEAKAEYRRLVEPVYAGLTRTELRDIAVARRLIFAPVARVSDLFTDDQLSLGQFFVDHLLAETGVAVKLPGAPYRLSEPVWRIGTGNERNA